MLFLFSASFKQHYLGEQKKNIWMYQINTYTLQFKVLL
jgi:hypothetical protein